MPKLPASLERSTILKAIRAPDQGPQVVAYDQFVTDHLRKTGRSVQTADIAYSLLALGVGWLVLLLAAALVEHWFTPHGFGVIARYSLFTLAVLATIWHVRVSLWPLLTGRINPLYTARAIESSAPSLKNGLINLLTLRGGKKIPTAVLATLEQHAAQGIASAPEEAVVDRTRLVRMAGALVVLLSAMAVYSLVSVKDPFVSAVRIVAPWAKIAPPSRVRVTQVTPGDTTLVEGQSFDIEARIEGLGDDENVFAVISTQDGQRQDDRVLMTYDDGLDRYVASVPTVGSRGQLGVSGEGQYRVAAGDGRSPDYRLKVLPAPTLVVTGVDYSFPAYTGLLDYTQQDAGDIRGIERTRVTLHAQANSPIKSASIDFEGDGSYDLAMQVDEDSNTATVTFELALRADRVTPKHTSYLLRLKTHEGLVNTRPAKHKIEVYPDYPPEVDLVLPEEQERPVRLNETVVIQGTARDPDFALADLRLYGECQGERVANKRLLMRPVKGKHQAEFNFTPSQFGLQVGDRVEYWLEATDNRRPDPQTAVTQHQTFVISSPDPRDNQRQNEMADADDQQGQPDQNNSGEQGDQSQQDQQDGQQGQKNSSGQGQSGDSSGQGNDGQKGESQPSDSDASDSGEQNSGGQGQSTSDSGESQASQQPQNGASSDGSSGDKNQSKNSQQSSAGQQNNSSESGSDSSQNNPDQSNPNQGGQPRGDQQGGDKQGGADQQREPSESGDSQPVDNSGADDAEAFDRILDHLDKNQQPNSNADGNAGKQNQPNNDSSAQQDHQANPQGQGGASEGSGADTQGGDTQRQEDDLGKEPSEQSEQSPGGKQATPNGDPSATGSQGKPEGAPGSDPRQRPTEKQQPNPGGKNSEQQDAPAPANGEQESDSQGDQSGDRPGGGDEGGGQRGQREGTGSSGENTAADEGAGKSSEQGAGETGDQAGSDQASDDPTGESGESPGEGSSKSDGAGDKPGGDQQSEAGDSSTGASGDDTSPAGDHQTQQDEGNADQSSSKNGQPQRQNQGEPSQSPEQADPAEASEGDNQGELKPGEQQGPPPRGSSNAQSTAGGDVGADDANLDYARQKTDLVLEKLSDQLDKQQVDEELLDSLGWSQDDLQRFVKRWRQRKSAAQRPNAGKSAKAQLDAALKSLGLKPKTLSSDTQRTADDLRNQASGRSSNVPLKFRQRMQRYNQGVSGAGE